MESNRESSLDKLKVFLINPGMFSLMVIGDRGVGKRYSIEKVFNDLQEYYKDDLEEKCLKELNFVEANSINKKEDFDKLFEENEFKTLVFEDIDELDEELEKLLFVALSTTDGTFGIKNKYNLRIVFTSNKSADDLRADGVCLTGILWDRISQLIVEFPSYKTDNSTIQKDFEITWKKMKFENLNEYKTLSSIPRNAKLQRFLEVQSPNFEGGFRDLDKIACLYFNYRIYHYKDRRKIDETLEDQVYRSVVNDFLSKTQMQGNLGNDYSVFEFKKDKTHQELLGDYKIQLRKWAINTYGGTIANAERKLGLKPGSMKNYVEGRVTTEAKKK
ncbi:hypothetical protein [Flavobacterium ardleyense]|uniref:hypothetical protein n=1 Tax=Flavobacterium ardleyense TaxID=2038737 RepID=UPI00298CEDEB|nr:hypothetical protein [Flavobacterium ardleyense]